MADKLKIVGRSVQRIDAYEKVTGAAKYAGDIRVYGMLHGKVLRSPYAHAKIVSIDISKAEKLDGVKAILTYRDVPPTLLGEMGVEDAPVLPERVRFVGDEVVAVAAETEEIAEKALELIHVEYKELLAVFKPEEALKPGAPLIPPEECCKSNLQDNPRRTMTLEKGNVEEGFKQADYVFEDIYHTSFVQHMPIEPRACLASWEGDKLTIWVGSQTPFGYRHTIARVLGIPETKVKLISVYLGGSFGSKYEGRYAILAALLAKKAGRPVRLRFTKEEDMLSKMRPSSVINVKMGVKEKGTFTAIHSKLTTASGGYNWSLTTAGTLPIRALFRTPNSKYETYSIYTNHPYTGEWRGVANGLMTFGVAQLTDKIAERLGFRDLIEFVRKTHIQSGDECSSAYEKFGVVLSSCGLDECLERGAEAIGWEEKWKGWKTPVEVKGSKRIGIGMAPMTHHSSPGSFSSSAVVKLNLDGTVTLLTPVTEHGQGAATTQTQILSETSGIPFEDISVMNSDTESIPLDPIGQVASVAAHVAGLSTKKAGEDFRQQILERAALELGVTPEALDIDDGKIYIRGNPKVSMTIKVLAEKMMVGLTPIIGRGSVTCPNWPQKARCFGAHFAEVEVDTETGEVRVLKYVAAHDVGRALNPVIVEGQIHGGALMGLGWALIEELIFDRYGKPLNLNSIDYKIFTSADYPEIIPIIVESNDPLGPYGAKGFAEGPAIPVAGCIANAIYNALGVRFKELPITPEKVLKMYWDRSI